MWNFVSYEKQKKIICVKSKKHDRICLIDNWNHGRDQVLSPRYRRLLPTNDNLTIITVAFWWEEVAGQIHWKKLLCKPQFAIFIVLCDFQAVKSFTVQVNQLIDA